MKRILCNVLFAGVACLSGCIFTPDKVITPPVRGVYSEPTAPESLITNLQVSYRNREVDHYAKILAPEFIFKFQPLDANDIGSDFWTRDQDSTGTRALLTATLVSEIKITLLYGARDTTVNFPGTPLDSLKIRIINTDLQVDQTDGITWVVTDQQDMFFRSGIEANGEDPTHWFLYEWDDIPTLSAPGIGTLSAGSYANQEKALSWGTLLQNAISQKTASR